MLWGFIMYIQRNIMITRALRWFVFGQNSSATRGICFCTMKSTLVIHTIIIIRFPIPYSYICDVLPAITIEEN